MIFLHLTNSSQHAETREHFNIAELAQEAEVHLSWHKERSHAT